MMPITEIRPDMVAIYIRWSTDDQGAGTTLETQLERCRYYLGSQGWRFSENLVYIDDGYSGGSLDRPALTQLRTDVESGKVQCVVCYKIDRLSRSVVDIVELVLREWEGRCFVKSTTEEVNTLTPAGKMFFYILVSFAEYERNVIKERTMGGKVKRAEQGLNPGFRPPYGYTRGRDAGTVTVVEHEASVVRRIFDLYLKGNGTGQIAQALNAEGNRRRGELWNQQMIRRALSNPAYSGVLEYGRTMRTSKEQRERQGLGNVIHFEQPRLARVEGAFPAIVERSTWGEVQKLLQARSTRKGTARPSYSNYLLSGLATCKCGAPIGGKGAGSHYYYYCTARKRHGASVCDAAYVPVDVINTEIERRVEALLTKEGCLAGVLEEDLARRLAEYEVGITQAKLALAALADRRRRAQADYRNGDLPASLYAGEVEAAGLDEQRGRERLANLQAHLAGLKELKACPEPTFLMADLWDSLVVPEQKQLLEKLTAGIRLYRRAGPGEPPILELDWIRLG